MTQDFLTALTGRYDRYVDAFRAADGTLSQMLQLKLDHTRYVVENARQIMAGEKWPTERRVAGEACALLHDTGRYSQLRDFGTFEDAKSFDHAMRSVEVVESSGWLNGLAADERQRILRAVALHNKKIVPDSLDEASALLAHLVRDADKLDIFRVMETAVTDGSLARNPEIAWGLRVKGAPSPEVVASISAGRPVSYTWIKTLSDFVLIQVGWLNGGLHFPTSCRLACERRALEFREAYLKTLSDDPGVDRCCSAARAWLADAAGCRV